MKSVEELAKAHANLEQAVGRKGILLPRDATKPEQVAEFRKALGVPDKPEDYAWTPPDGYDGDGMELKEIAAGLHKHHLSGEQFKGVMDYYAGKQAEVRKQIESALVAERAATVTELKAAWGDNYEADLKLANEVGKRTGLGEVFKNAGLGNNLAALKALREIAKYLPEDGAAGGGAKGGDGMRAELEAMKTHPAFTDKLHPAHGDMMRRREEIYRTLYPTPK